MNLNVEEKQFLDQVIQSLKTAHVKRKDIGVVKQQILEHIDASKEHGEDSLESLGTPDEFLNQFFDVHPQIHQKGRSSFSLRRSFFLQSTLIAAFVYMITQSFFSLFLTTSFAPYETSSFTYNIFYRISNDVWWNALLVSSSGCIAVLSAFITVFIFKRKAKNT